MSSTDSALGNLASFSSLGKLITHPLVQVMGSVVLFFFSSHLKTFLALLPCPSLLGDSPVYH